MHNAAISRRTLVGGLTAAGITTLTGMHSTGAQTPEASPVSTDPETLFEVTFLRDWQPEGKAQGAFYRIILQPGDELTYLPGPYCGCSGETIREGTAAEQIMSGEYTVTLDRPFLLRRDGAEEEIGAEQEVVLQAGDIAIYPDALAFGTMTNTGEEEIVIFGASITSIEVHEGTFTPPLPENMSARLSVAVNDAWQTLGEGDIPARLTRRLLPAGGEIGPYEIVGLEAIHAAEGEFHGFLIRPEESAPTGDPLYVREGGTAAFRKTRPGTKRLIENPFEAQATLLTLGFLPVS